MKQLLLVFLLFCCALDSSAQSDGENICIGKTIQIRSNILSETRKLNIYLPPNYSKNDTTHYSVIYLLDGGLDEDFIHVVGLVQFNTFSWVHQIPNSIVVGIVNVDRERDMTYPTNITDFKKRFPNTGGSTKFIDFIEQELKPHIRNTYKTNNEDMIIGQSLGGLLATEILLKRPQLFDRYLILSPSLWWDDGSLLKNDYKLSLSYPNVPTKVYIAVGKEGLTPGNPPHVMEVDANLLVDKIRKTGNKQIQLSFDYLPHEDHATIGHQAILNGFKALYP